MSQELDFLSIQKKIILVMAHPDDEIIFANSVLSRIDKIIICFQNIPGEVEISKGRQLSALKYPLKNFLQLGITQARFSGEIIDWNKPLETKYGIKGYLNQKDYKKNYLLLFEKLSSYLTKDVLVITHNPWGEYGHPEHIQVNRVISELANLKKFEYFVTGFVSTSTLNFSRKCINRLSENFIEYKTNIQLYESIKNLYLKNKCWTWFSDKKINRNEIFYKQIKFSIQDLNCEKSINQRDLFVIDDGSNFSRNFLHILKLFLPYFIKKFLRSLKLRYAK